MSQSAGDGPGVTRRRTLGWLGASAGALAWGPQGAGQDGGAGDATESVGPMVGHVTPTSARVWFRPGGAWGDSAAWMCVASDDEAVVSSDRAVRRDALDGTCLADITGLSPSTNYRLVWARWTEGGGRLLERHEATFRTPPADGEPARVTIGFGSCADTEPNTVWSRVIDEGCDGFVFLGDTPYVDSSDPAVAMAKHRAFLAEPDIAAVASSMPCWGTWDDHDFGQNDAHGDFAGKAATRPAFCAYRANATFGHDAEGAPITDPTRPGEGVYTRFRYGPIEVFLLDPRWFSRTEPSWADPAKPTYIGATQWAWLREGLAASTAPFKALASGMIWDDKAQGRLDDWHMYAHERDAIFDFVRDEGIAGVFLIAGDIHVSRALNYGPRVGYDLWQFISSPMHGRNIPERNVPDPALVHSAVHPNVFTTLTADTTVQPATLTARWVDCFGVEVFRVELTGDDLRPTRVGARAHASDELLRSVGERRVFGAPCAFR